MKSTSEEVGDTMVRDGESATQRMSGSKEEERPILGISPPHAANAEENVVGKNYQSYRSVWVMFLYRTKESVT